MKELKVVSDRIDVLRDELPFLRKIKNFEPSLFFKRDKVRFLHLLKDLNDVTIRAINDLRERRSIDIIVLMKKRDKHHSRFFSEEGVEDFFVFHDHRISPLSLRMVPETGPIKKEHKCVFKHNVFFVYNATTILKCVCSVVSI